MQFVAVEVIGKWHVLEGEFDASCLEIDCFHDIVELLVGVLGIRA